MGWKGDGCKSKFDQYTDTNPAKELPNSEPIWTDLPMGLTMHASVWNSSKFWYTQLMDEPIHSYANP